MAARVGDYLNINHPLLSEVFFFQVSSLTGYWVSVMDLRGKSNTGRRQSSSDGEGGLNDLNRVV